MKEMLCMESNATPAAEQNCKNYFAPFAAAILSPFLVESIEFPELRRYAARGDVRAALELLDSIVYPE